MSLSDGIKVTVDVLLFMWLLIGPIWVALLRGDIDKAKIGIADLDDDMKKVKEAVRELAKSKENREDPPPAKDGPYRTPPQPPIVTREDLGGGSQMVTRVNHPQTVAALKGDRLNLGFYIYEGMVYGNWSAKVPVVGESSRRASDVENKMWEALS